MKSQRITLPIHDLSSAEDGVLIIERASCSDAGSRACLRQSVN